MLRPELSASDFEDTLAYEILCNSDKKQISLVFQIDRKDQIKKIEEHIKFVGGKGIFARIICVTKYKIEDIELNAPVVVSDPEPNVKKDIEFPRYFVMNLFLQETVHKIISGFRFGTKSIAYVMNAMKSIRLKKKIAMSMLFRTENKPHFLMGFYMRLSKKDDFEDFIDVSQRLNAYTKWRGFIGKQVCEDSDCCEVFGHHKVVVFGQNLNTACTGLSDCYKYVGQNILPSFYYLIKYKLHAPEPEHPNPESGSIGHSG